ncbi:unnamed protein product [Gulo gulo]|uniref:Uncharacterized protein n=1 Tax=Gulo gulo TaxID=48420 RepID=A0A9X9LJW4_GULGU|nr:unnamed protein product [Gulo gulo]
METPQPATRTSRRSFTHPGPTRSSLRPSASFGTPPTGLGYACWAPGSSCASTPR